jgi:ATP-dependent DNA helicase DinG
MPAADAFAPGGLLAKRMPGFAFNPGQPRMAALVEQALADREYLVIEAGTGTGKTLAYLLPAVESGRKIVVSTATKALQEQLIEKDIPLLQKDVGLRFEAVQMKGRGNYLCPRRLRAFAENPLFAKADEVPYWPRIARWAERTETGDRAELAGLPEDLKVWEEIQSTSDRCGGSRCEFERICFITKLRARAAGADVVVVNHHLFFADLAVRERPHAEVIPRYEAVVFDEAHQIESVATEFFGVSVSNYRFEEIVRDARAALAPKKKDPLEKVLRAVQEESARVLGPLAARSKAEGRFRLDEKALSPEVQKAMGALSVSLTKLGNAANAHAADGDDKTGIARRAEDLRTQTARVLAFDDPKMVYWGERRGKGMFLSASPVDVAEELAERLYARTDTLVFTSATLSTGGNFDYFRGRVGLSRECVEEIIPSHFDFAAQALLYLPKNLPDPRETKFADAMAREVFRILTASRGRAFVLFTSYRNMEDVHARLEGKLPYQTMVQGRRPKSTLLTEFRADVHSVLFATTSFWQGVDVKGEALSCVIIDKLPFDAPSEPIVQARIERIQQGGGSPFREFQLPEAIIQLKQGIGRLIRDRKDRGAVVICDPRLTSKSYGKTILASLPAFPVTHDFAALKAFFETSTEA